MGKSLIVCSWCPKSYIHLPFQAIPVITDPLHSCKCSDIALEPQPHSNAWKPVTLPALPTAMWTAQGCLAQEMLVTCRATRWSRRKQWYHQMAPAWSTRTLKRNPKNPQKEPELEIDTTKWRFWTGNSSKRWRPKRCKEFNMISRFSNFDLESTSVSWFPSWHGCAPKLMEHLESPSAFGFPHGHCHAIVPNVFALIHRWGAQRLGFVLRVKNFWQTSPTSKEETICSDSSEYEEPKDHKLTSSLLFWWTVTWPPPPGKHTI